MILSNENVWAYLISWDASQIISFWRLGWLFFRQQYMLIWAAWNLSFYVCETWAVNQLRFFGNWKQCLNFGLVWKLHCLCLGMYGECTDLLNRVLVFMVCCSQFRLLPFTCTLFKHVFFLFYDSWSKKATNCRWISSAERKWEMGSAAWWALFLYTEHVLFGCICHWKEVSKHYIPPKGYITIAN